MDSPATLTKEQPELCDLREEKGLMRFFKRKTPFLCEFLLTFVLFFGRFLYYGWTYFYQLDDYIQYHNYTEYYHLRVSDLWNYVADYLGLFTARPLAAFGDIYVISKYFSSLIVVVLALSAMYAAAAVILRGIFNKLFGTGYFFTAVFCLFPLAFEGLYWVSASSRIVPSLFFAALAARFMLELAETGKIRYVVLFTLAQIVSFGYYEQITVLSIALSVMIIIIKRNKWQVPVLLIVANLLLYVLYSELAQMMWGGGIYASRSEIALPFITSDYFTTVFPSATGQIFQAAGAFAPVANARALFRGFKFIIQDGAFVYLVAFFALTILIAVLLWKRGDEEKTEKKKVIAAVLWGIFLAVAPLAPFYILKSSWIGIRAIVPCLCGAALILDTLLRLITRSKKAIVVPFIAFVIFVSCIASVSELHDYREVTEFDNAVAQMIVEGTESFIQAKDADEDTDIAIINIDSATLAEQNYRHHEHISSATAASWSFTGLLRCLSGNGDFPNVTAMPVDGNGYFYYAAHGNSYRIENYDYVFVVKDGELLAVNPVQSSVGEETVENSGTNYRTYMLYNDGTSCVAKIVEYSDHGTIEFYW
ncbi:MAG: glucosyltransferase domain-containing protein [Clostridia bacterium]|nr:glucosyltransferase domain-containing protein [Clostridia bacterium]